MDFNLSPVDKMIAKTAKDFCDREIMPLAEKIVADDDFPPDFLPRCAKARLLGVTVPKEFGGVGANNLQFILMAEELGKTGTTSFWPLAMNNSVADVIAHHGNEDVKKRFLPPLCDGSAYASMAFTEPGTGSDPRAITTTAALDGDHYVVNGSKRFITNGNKPGYGLFHVRDLSLNSEKDLLTALIIEKNSPGYATSAPWKLMGLEGMNCVDVHFKDVRVPRDRVVGEPGKSFKILLAWIAEERIQQAAYMLGLGQAALDEAVGYAKTRLVGGKPMAAMQGIQWMLADMKVRLDACRMLVYRAAWMRDQGQSIEVVSAELKTFVTPNVQEVCRQALQIHGAYGYSREYKVERLYRYAAHAGVVATSTEINRTIAGASLAR